MVFVAMIRPRAISMRVSFSIRNPISTGIPRVGLRNATLTDANLLQQWDNQEYLQDPNVMGDEDCNAWDWEQELQRTDATWRQMLIAQIMSQENPTPIGFVQIIDPVLEDTSYWGLGNSSTIAPGTVLALDIWIGNPDFLGQGYGTEIMNLVLRDYCFADNKIDSVWVDPMAANTRAHNFYQMLGFQPQGIQYFGPDKCLVHKLARQDYLRLQTTST